MYIAGAILCWLFLIYTIFGTFLTDKITTSLN